MISQSIGNRLIEYLRQLIKEGADGDILIVSIGNHYVQFLGPIAGEAASLYCEVVSNESIPGLVSEFQASELRRLGFEDPAQDAMRTGYGTPNFSREFDASDPDALSEIVRKTLAIFYDIFGLNIDLQPEFSLELKDLEGEFERRATKGWPSALTETVKTLRDSGVVCQTVLFSESHAVSQDGRLAVCSTYGCIHPEDSFVIWLLDLSRKTVLAKFEPIIGLRQKWPREYMIDFEKQVVHLIYDDVLNHRYSFDGRFLDTERWEADRLYLANISPYGYRLLDIALERLKRVSGSRRESYSEIVSILDASLQKSLSANTQSRVHRTLGEIYYRCGDNTKALRHLQMALDLNPSVGVKRLMGRLGGI